MNKRNATHRTLSAILLCALTACSTAPTTTPSQGAIAAATSAFTIPSIPAPVPVALDAKTTALLILDISTAICQPNPDCIKTVPSIASLLNKARAAKVPVIYSSTVNPAGPPPMLPAIAPQADEPIVLSRANKFTGTSLEEVLRLRNARTLVVAGSSANGAVLYTSFHANSRGFTVVVPEDGISSAVPVNTQLAKYQLLNQPGFMNPDNTPLVDQRVTLSRSDLITFR